MCPSLPKSFLGALGPSRCRWTVVLRDVIPLHSPVCSPSAPYFPINEMEMVALKCLVKIQGRTSPISSQEDLPSTLSVYLVALPQGVSRIVGTTTGKAKPKGCSSVAPRACPKQGWHREESPSLHPPHFLEMCAGVTCKDSAKGPRTGRRAEISRGDGVR